MDGEERSLSSWELDVEIYEKQYGLGKRDGEGDETTSIGMGNVFLDFKHQFCIYGHRRFDFCIGLI